MQWREGIAPILMALVVVALTIAVPPAVRSWAAPTEGDWRDSLAGRLLVASEKMTDPRFDKTVIYMVEHDAEGAMGLVVNVPLGAVSASKLLDHLGVEEKDATGEIKIFFGGPVAPTGVFLLHSSDVLFPGSRLVDKQFALTTERQILQALARGEGPAHSLFILGYSGWGPGQLESELARDSWFVIPSDQSLVFAANPAMSWERAAARRSLDL